MIRPEVVAIAAEATAAPLPTTPEGEMRLVALPGFVWDELVRIAAAEHKAPAVVLADILRTRLTGR